jgi:hypothetical protein
MSTYSREFLQTYRQNVETIRYCDSIQAKVLNAALKGQNRYVEPFNSKKQSISNEQYVETNHMIIMLKSRFPDCLVEYQEVKNIHGKLEAGIVVDWS